MPPNPLQSVTLDLSQTARFAEVASDVLEPRARVPVICPEAANAITIAALWHRLQRPMLVITPNPDSAQRLIDQIPTWMVPHTPHADESPIHHFAETESIPFERYDPDRGAAHQRIAAIDALARAAEPGAGAPPLVISSVHAAAERTFSTELHPAAVSEIRLGDRLEMSDLLRNWINAGYEVHPAVEVPGNVSRRGGILDIFPIDYSAPVRIELFGDEVESMRIFDVETQLSNELIESLRIIPAREELPSLIDHDTLHQALSELDTDNMDFTRLATQRISSDLKEIAENELHRDLTFFGGFFKLGTIFDFLPSDGVVVAMRPHMIAETALGQDRRNADVRRVKERRGEVPRRFPVSHASWNEIAAGIESAKHRIEISPFGVDAKDLGDKATLPLSPPPLTVNRNQPEEPSEYDQSRHDAPIADPILPIKQALESGAAKVVVVTGHEERLRELTRAAGIDRVEIVEGYATAGFSVEFGGDDRLAVLTDAEVFGIRKQRRVSRRRAIRKGPKLEELQPGVYVVHIDHGIARFQGTTVKQEDGREHLILQYARGDKVYIPTEHLDRIQIYQGGGESPPRLSRLGTQEWRSARRRAKQATEQVASELLTLYASRMLAGGLRSEPDTPWQHALETSFPYEETADQATAIDAVKAEMENPNAMDRIICGDVGFGKTEIAVRAAFKSVQTGRQVAILVPTTLLAQQHFDTFRQRLAPFPVEIEALSRFRTRSEQKDILQRLAGGSIDIVIGTHRLTQRDVRFKNLGLVVIDEEQKFGVQHKEHLKRLRAEVDVLTLSATPIPRTLYMSLAGIRDMSNIETPPEERLPVRTFVSESTDDLIRQAILREIDRGGQVFFLHNRVKDIERVSRKLRSLVPEATFAIGHGQMPEGHLEQVMTAFDQREFDVLVCTTIIEAGIDMPNVNTLIVNDADRFGLAQLHHIRGRVGRSARQAFSYLLVQPNKSLTEEAEARLNTILSASELGSGYQIAMRDLEIRGMGNVVGAEQSGHVAAIGLHLYTQLLAQSVEELKRSRNIHALADESPDATSNGRHDIVSINHHESPEALLEQIPKPDVRLGLDDRIPDEYIEDLAQRLAIYQRISWCRTDSQLAELSLELRDRFGPPPRNVDYLLETARIRLLARAADVSSVRVTEDRALFVLNSPVGGARARLQELLGPDARVGNSQITFTFDPDEDVENWVDEIAAVLETVESFRQRLMSLITA